MHDRVLLDALVSVWLLGMGLWLSLTAQILTISYIYGVRFCIWTFGRPQTLKTHRKAFTNTLPCILKHLTAFEGAWGPADDPV